MPPSGARLGAKLGQQLRTRKGSASSSGVGGFCQPLTRHVHVPVLRAQGCLLLRLVLDHVVDAEAVDALLPLAVGLARRLVGPAVAGQLAALELGARLGGPVLDLLVGLRLGDGVVEELQVVLGDDRGGWKLISDLARFG